ncbi:hypothetical protein MQE23_42100 [Streptomyces sp. HP-A2021]|nr:hypothetical protein [Streptomyces sp. HP-A2021]UOB15256.1 hypothetical protein MQE23_42100 [Streptomyces sp. HP-A2021]
MFAGFIGMHSPTIQTMGAGLAVAVAFDAFVGGWRSHPRSWRCSATGPGGCLVS